MTRPDVMIARPIMDAPFERLRERCDVTVHENEFGIPREELLEVVAGRDAIVTMLTEKVDAEFLAAAGPKLRIVANHAVGFDNVDLEACTAAGVLASNTPDVLTETTADTAFALIMAAARRIGEGERLLRGRPPGGWGGGGGGGRGGGGARGGGGRRLDPHDPDAGNPPYVRPRGVRADEGHG